MATASADRHLAVVTNRLSVRLVTPKGRILDRELDEITAPGLLGEFGVLPGHVPFLTAIRPGVLKLRDGQKVDIYAVGRGYAQVGFANRVEILVDVAVPAGQVDADAARKDVEQGEKELAGGSEERDRLAIQVAWGRARLDARDAASKSLSH